MSLRQISGALLRREEETESSSVLCCEFKKNKPLGANQECDHLKTVFMVKYVFLRCGS